MIWNSFLRGKIQTYFPTALLTFGSLKAFFGKERPIDTYEGIQNGRQLEVVNYEWLEVEESITSYIMTFQKFLLLIFLPFFSFIYLKKNKLLLSETDFESRFLSLYAHLKTTQCSAYKHTFYFTLRRLLLTLATIFLNNHIGINLFYTIFSSLFMNMYLFNNNPYKISILNNFEKMNEVYTLFLSYTIVINSNFVHEPEAKYTMGWWFTCSLLLNGCLNISLISYDMAIESYLKVRRAYHEKKWKKDEEMRVKMSKFIIYDSMKEYPGLIKSNKELQLYILFFKKNFTITEMSDKIKEIFERREASENDEEKAREKKLQQKQSIRVFCENRMQSVVRNPILIIDNDQQPEVLPPPLAQKNPDKKIVSKQNKVVKAKTKKLDSKVTKSKTKKQDSKVTESKTKNLESKVTISNSKNLEVKSEPKVKKSKKTQRVGSQIEFEQTFAQKVIEQNRFEVYVDKDEKDRLEAKRVYQEMLINQFSD